MITFKDKTFESWDDVVKQYPAMWVVFDKAEIKHGRVQIGDILAVLPDDEILYSRHKHRGAIKISLRTTETISAYDGNGNYVGVSGGAGGYIHGELIND
jgi:hypothetical protein